MNVTMIIKTLAKLTESHGIPNKPSMIGALVSFIFSPRFHVLFSLKNNKINHDYWIRKHKPDDIPYDAYVQLEHDDGAQSYHRKPRNGPQSGALAAFFDRFAKLIGFALQEP